MKKTLLILLSLGPVCSFAQTPERLDISKGKKITIVKSTVGDADLGMGMSMNTKSSEFHNLEVLDQNENTIIIKHVLSRLTMDMDAMGQQNSYDSDKPSDRTSEMGKEIPEEMFATDTLQVDRITGKILNKKEKKKASGSEEENPMNGMIQALGSGVSSSIIEDVLFSIPKDIKAGGQWVDSSSAEKGMKITRNYTYNKLENGIATVQLKEVSDLSTTSEVQGMSMQLTMNKNSQSTLQLEAKSGLITKKEMTADVNGAIEVMGQNSPISSKSSMTITVTAQ